jgi:hypothetical protein
MEWPWDIIRCLLSLVCGIVSLILGTKLEFEKDRPMLYAPWWVMLLTVRANSVFIFILEF